MGADDRIDRFNELLRKASAELAARNPTLMDSGELLATTNVIDGGDVELFFEGAQHGLISVEADGRFNTLDRPAPGGRWALLSRTREGGWYNAEYLPQIAAYVAAIRSLGYPAGRVLFELPPAALQLDLAILDDAGRVIVLGEAKRDTAMIEKLRSDLLRRFSTSSPGDETKRRGDEARQLAWRLWTVRPDYLWLIGPGERTAYQCRFDPLRLDRLAELPTASGLGLAADPGRQLPPPHLLA